MRHWFRTAAAAAVLTTSAVAAAGAPAYAIPDPHDVCAVFTPHRNHDGIAVAQIRRFDARAVVYGCVHFHLSTAPDGSWIITAYHYSHAVLYRNGTWAWIPLDWATW